MAKAAKGGKKSKKSTKRKSLADTTNPGSNGLSIIGRWPGATDPETFAKRAASVRETIRSASVDVIVTLRVRQVDWDYHDFYVSLPKRSTVFTLQCIIAGAQHLGAVLPDDVVIYRTPPRRRSQMGEESGREDAAAGKNVTVGGEGKDAEVSAGGGEDAEAKKVAEVENAPRGGGSGSVPAAAMEGGNLMGQGTCSDPFRTLVDYFPDVVAFRQPELSTGEMESTGAKSGQGYMGRPIGSVVYLHELMSDYGPQRTGGKASFAASGSNARPAGGMGGGMGQPSTAALPAAVNIYYDITPYIQTSRQPAAIPSSSSSSPPRRRPFSAARPASTTTAPSQPQPQPQRTGDGTVQPARDTTSHSTPHGLDRSHPLLMREDRDRAPRPRSAPVAPVPSSWVSGGMLAAVYNRMASSTSVNAKRRNAIGGIGQESVGDLVKPLSLEAMSVA